MLRSTIKFKIWFNSDLFRIFYSTSERDSSNIAENEEQLDCYKNILEHKDKDLLVDCNNFHSIYSNGSNDYYKHILLFVELKDRINIIKNYIKDLIVKNSEMESYSYGELESEFREYKIDEELRLKKALIGVNNLLLKISKEFILFYVNQSEFENFIDLFYLAYFERVSKENINRDYFYTKKENVIQSENALFSNFNYSTLCTFSNFSNSSNKIIRNNRRNILNVLTKEFNIENIIKLYNNNNYKKGFTINMSAVAIKSFYIDELNKLLIQFIRNTSFIKPINLEKYNYLNINQSLYNKYYSYFFDLLKKIGFKSIVYVYDSDDSNIRLSFNYLALDYFKNKNNIELIFVDKVKNDTFNNNVVYSRAIADGLVEEQDKKLKHLRKHCFKIYFCSLNNLVLTTRKMLYSEYTKEELDLLNSSEGSKIKALIDNAKKSPFPSIASADYFNKILNVDNKMVWSMRSKEIFESIIKKNILSLNNRHDLQKANKIYKDSIFIFN